MGALPTLCIAAREILQEVREERRALLVLLRLDTAKCRRRGAVRQDHGQAQEHGIL